MKNIKQLLIPIILFVMASCAPALRVVPDSVYVPTFGGDIESALLWVHNNVTYSRDATTYGRLELWASPLRTLYEHRGDCDDMAILFAWFGKEQFDVEMDFVLSATQDAKFHLSCYSSGVHYDPTVPYSGPSLYSGTGLVEIARFPYSYFLDRARSLK